MYTVKANGNYNIILKDIGVYFRYPSEVSITSEQYGSSRDLKILEQANVITVIKQNLIQAIDENTKSIGASGDNVVFVSEGRRTFEEVSNSSAEESKVVVQEVQHYEENVDEKANVDSSIQEAIVRDGEKIEIKQELDEEVTLQQKDTTDVVLSDLKEELEIKNVNNEEVLDSLEKTTDKVEKNNVSEEKKGSFGFGKKKVNKK